jgi:membrane-associated phospholipid phosphatase
MQRILAGLLLAGAVTPSFAQVQARPDRVGDTLQVVLPLAAAAYAWHQDDPEGLKSLGYSLALSQGTTEALKHLVHSRRPDGTGLGFPSGHASIAFASAGFIHARYGWQQALPFYGLSTWTAYSRVHTHHHFARDVIGGALIGTGASFLLTKRLNPSATASLHVQDHGVHLHFVTTW